MSKAKAEEEDCIMKNLKRCLSFIYKYYDDKIVDSRSCLGGRVTLCSHWLVVDL